MLRLLLCICLLPLAGCEPLAISMLGAGAGAALRYSIDGVTYRTFTSPAPAVKESTLAALQRMGITLASSSSYETGEILFAYTRNRSIDIEIEPISERATRVRIAAKNGSIFYDNATALEIVLQTERLLDSAARGATAGATARSF